MNNFDKGMALGEIEDALANTDTEHGRGLAIGLCGAFYMCGLLNMREWEMYMDLIPQEPCEFGSGETRWAGHPGSGNRFLN